MFDSPVNHGCLASDYGLLLSTILHAPSFTDVGPVWFGDWHICLGRKPPGYTRNQTGPSCMVRPIRLVNAKDLLYSSQSTTSNDISKERMGHETLWDFSEPFRKTLPSSKRIPSVTMLCQTITATIQVSQHKWISGYVKNKVQHKLMNNRSNTSKVMDQ